VVERCTNDHNYSAILRTVEALGVATIYMIDPPDVVMEEDENMLDQQQNKIQRTQEEINQRRLHHIFARNATEWITVRDFETVEDCVACCRKQGYKLWVTVSLNYRKEGMNESILRKKIKRKYIRGIPHKKRCKQYTNTIIVCVCLGSFASSRSIRLEPESIETSKDTR
jgi:hypothetical protein